MKALLVSALLLSSCVPAMAQDFSCFPLDEGTEMIENQGLVPKFVGMVDGSPATIYLMIQPETGEWVALSVNQEADEMCVLQVGEAHFIFPDGEEL